MQETSPEQRQWESEGLWTQERMVSLDYKAAGREMGGDTRPGGSLPGGGDSEHRAASCLHKEIGSSSLCDAALVENAPASSAPDFG